MRRYALENQTESHYIQGTMDSDGFIGQLILFWIEAGFTHCDPIEVAAGNDINEFRARFGTVSRSYRLAVRRNSKGVRKAAEELKMRLDKIEGTGK